MSADPVISLAPSPAPDTVGTNRQTHDDYHHAIDDLERALLADPSSQFEELPLNHVFTPGVYTRQIFMRAGVLCTSKIHKVRHPYVVLFGRVSVFTPGTAVTNFEPTIEHITAPHFGITEPGTRRVLYMHEDTVWMTFHPNGDDTEDLTVIEDRLIERRELDDDGHTTFELYNAAMSAIRQLTTEGHK